MQVVFKLFPNQLLNLGIQLERNTLELVLTDKENFVFNVKNKITCLDLPFTVSTKTSEIAFNGSREDFKILNDLIFNKLGVPTYKLNMVKYEDPGMTWLKPWENLKDVTEKRATPDQVIRNLKKNPDLKVDKAKILERLNLTKPYKLFKKEDWKQLQASFTKEDIFFLKEFDKLVA